MSGEKRTTHLSSCRIWSTCLDVCDCGIGIEPYPPIKPTREQMNCGRCLYGPPALCTCGTCPDNDDDEEEPSP